MNPAAVRKANAQFHASHPELGGRELTMDAADRQLRAEWMALYKAADAEDKPGFGACNVGDAVAGCPPAKSEPPPKPPPEEKPICSIEVRASQLNSTLDYYHLFIVFTDGAGQQFFLRGGPTAAGGRLPAELSGGSSNASSQSSSGSGSNSARSSDSSDKEAGGPFGAIGTTYGKYEPGTIDWDPGAKAVTLKKDADACALYGSLVAQMEAITASRTPYNPIGPNSNTTVFTALKNLGLDPVTPDGVWAPGKDQGIKTSPPRAKL